MPVERFAARFVPCKRCQHINIVLRDIQRRITADFFRRFLRLFFRLCFFRHFRRDRFRRFRDLFRRFCDRGRDFCCCGNRFRACRFRLRVPLYRARQRADTSRRNDCNDGAQRDRRREPAYHAAFPPLLLLPPLRWPALLLPPRRRPSLTSF